MNSFKEKSMNEIYQISNSAQFNVQLSEINPYKDQKGRSTFNFLIL